MYKNNNYQKKKKNFRIYQYISASALDLSTVFASKLIKF